MLVEERKGGWGIVTLEASQTERECSPYCSTSGNMLLVTMRCALLKLWSISGFDTGE